MNCTISCLYLPQTVFLAEAMMESGNTGLRRNVLSRYTSRAIKICGTISCPGGNFNVSSLLFQLEYVDLYSL